MRYISDLTDRQWELIKEIFEEKRCQHIRKHTKRELINAVLYRVKTGCPWRYLPKDFPDYRTVWSFYSRSVKKGLWEKAMDKIVKKVRVEAGRKEEPSYCLIDSQSVKTTSGNENIGIDGGKN